jgi:hypothetical protein
MSVPGEGIWKKTRQEFNPDFHPDLSKSTNQERSHNPGAQEDYLRELNERLESTPEEAREEIQKLIDRLTEMRDQSSH